MAKKNGTKGEAETGSSAGIDYRDTPKERIASRPFPARISDEYRVHIAPDAYERMKAHAATSDEVELCGVLVGDVCQDDQGIYLSITGAIEGEGANTYGTQVTFTQQTWDHIHRVREQDYPKAQIVGWFHTHPGFGVFLSGMDTFIQENFFNAPYQVAIVLETKAKQEGCFGWVDGRITPLQRYWVGDREVRLATGEAEPFEERMAAPDGSRMQASSAASAPQAPPEPPPPMGVKSLILMAVLCVLLGVFWGYSLTRRALFQALQTEFYALMEFTGINSAAAEDMHAVQGQVAKVRQDLEKAGRSEESKQMQAIEHLLAVYEKDYLDRDRESFRKRVSQLGRTRQTLAEQVDAANREARDLRLYVANIFIMRAADVLNRANVRRPADLPPQDAADFREILGTALHIEPAAKEMLRVQFPDWLEFLYPSPAPQKAPPAEGTKKEKE